MIDTIRVLAIAAVLSGAALVAFAWRIVRIDTAEPERLIGELRLAQWAAVMLSAVGAISTGLAIALPPQPLVGAEVALGIIVVAWAGVVLQRDPREALLFVSLGFLGHALITLGHRPGWLVPDFAPRWYLIGVTIYDVCLAAVCFWSRRR